PIWIEPAASGLTPMGAAFRAAVGPLRDWIGRHPDSFPPIVLNLTDGAYSDNSPAPTAWEIMSMSTADGSVLVFNCHISQLEGATQAFPDPGAASAYTGLSRELYDFSSPLPEVMRTTANGKGYTLQPGCRGYAYNAD